MNGNGDIKQSCSAYTSISEYEEDGDRLDPIDFFIVTRVPVETQRFKWIFNQFSSILSGKELYSCLHSPCYRLKFIKYNNGFGLFHVFQHNTTEQTKHGNAEPNFGFSFASSPKSIRMAAKNTSSCEDTCPHAIEYQVSGADKHGIERIKWTTCFSIHTECQRIGEYRSNSWKAFFNDVLVLHCYVKVIKTPETEKQFLDTESSLENHCWQKLSQDLKSMYQNSTNADLTLEVGSEEIRVNSFILAARSSVFKKMLHHDKEQNEPLSVAITDVPLPAMKRLVEFLYTGVVTDAVKDMTVQEVYDLFYAADKYEVMDLRKLCCTTLMSKASVNNACQILVWADRHNDEDLKSQILNFIRLNFETVVDSDVWRDFMSDEIKLANEALSFCVQKFKTDADK